MIGIKIDIINNPANTAMARITVVIKSFPVIVLSIESTLDKINAGFAIFTTILDSFLLTLSLI